MPGLSSVSGLVSGLSTDEIVAKIMQYKQRPVTVLKSQRDALTEKLTVWQSVNARLLAVKMKAAQLSTSVAFQAKTAESSNTNALTAAANTAATPGTYQIKVVSLATSQQMASDANYSSTTGVSLGAGTITFTNTETGAQSYVFVNEGADSLEGVRDAINAANAGVTASIVNDGSDTPYRLMLTSKATGTGGGFTVSASLTGGEGLSFTGPGSLLTPAEDAQIQIGSGATPITITSSSNTISDALPGITLNLLSATPDSTVTVTVAGDNTAIVGKVTDLVTSYNEFVDYVKEISSYDPETQTGGVLLGDFSLQNIVADMNSTLNRNVSGLSGTFAALSGVGVRLGTDGKLVLDEAALTAGLARDPSAVSRVFSRSGAATDSGIQFLAATGKTVESAGAGYAVEITQAATQTRVTAGASMSGALAQDEILTINGVTVNLTAGMDINAVVSAINAKQNLLGVRASATGSDGTGTGAFLTLTSVGYGSGAAVTALSNVSALSSGSTGIGTVAVSGSDAAGETGTGTGAQGLDVAGTINGELAQGSGRILTGMSGNARTAGLAILVGSTTTGSKGFVTYSRGVAAGIEDMLGSLTDVAGGTLTTTQQTVQSQINDLNDQMNDMIDRLSSEEERLYAQFAALESSLSALQAQSQFLTQSLASLSSSNSSNS